MRTTRIHKLQDVAKFKNKLLTWAQQFDDVVWLDSNNYKQNYASYDAVLAVDAFTSIRTDFKQGFEKLKEYQTYCNDWVFGYLSYDLKNDVEALNSKNMDGLGFSDLCFFQPKRLFLIKGNQLELNYLNAVSDEISDDLHAVEHVREAPRGTVQKDIRIKLRIHKDDYFEKVEYMLERIHRGDIYEANFCQEFYAEDTQINPLETYQKLNSISKPPFAAFVKIDDKYILSSSPERYIKKAGSHIISQPIKGTAKRAMNPDVDRDLMISLKNDKKERSENIMIVDLVRNDLSKTALKGSVQVEELCEIYTFDQVHQMISTVTSKVSSETHPVDIIKSTFPMGSMTGAPKISAMKIIESLEESKRGVYSGAIGYFAPSGDFDFNVVIRSILYNQTKKYVSYSVGGAITAKSDALKEYEECLVKAKAMRMVLEN
ncbi:aminodeoxychorismate synthase component I [uncultured Algibacter sp.]|uniref:aminodeoxychorismate synthase component I n=1 Tax=uncultured Algibacter sp. TaxID=298659 RepID=UPI0026353CD6|nr:aminodeoxychorismate synthase component I [uncultured Algibacter sp.]